MNRTRLHLISLVLAAAAAAALIMPDRGRCEGEVLTLDAAVKRAITKGPGIQPALTLVKAAEAGKKKAFASWFPVYSFELRALYYSEPPGIGSETMGLNIDPATIPPDRTDFDNWLLFTLSSLSDTFSSFKSEQYDVNITLTVTQPLTPLYQVYYANKLADLNIDVAQVQVKKTQLDLTYQVKEAYYSILKLMDALKAMDEGIASVTAHVQKAELFFAQKLITKNDLLQAKARLAEMEAQRISLQGALDVVGEGLNAAVGLKPGTVLVLEEPPRSFDGKVPTFDEAMKAAAANRPDMKELKLRAEQAGMAEKIAIGSFIPTVAAFGSYTHNEGSIMKYPPFAVGGVLSWDFWSFGSKYYELEAARLQRQAAEEGLEAMKAGVAVEIQDAISKIKVAVLTLEKEEANVEASEEQLRIEKERYAQNVNTSTEVLDAQTRLTQAQVQRASARFDIYIALAKLEKVTGKEWK
jgi:outer membrane protein